MYETLQQNAARISRPTIAPITFGPWTGGLLTSRDHEAGHPDECAEILNMVLTQRGDARTRDGISLVCSGVQGRVVAVGDVKVAGTWRTIISAVDDGPPQVYRLYVYERNGAGVTEIGTVEGEARFVGFNDRLIIFDGSFIKFWDGINLALCYDDGLGADSYHFNNRWGQADLTPPVVFVPQALGNGVVSRVAYRFTTGTWTTGYYIPPTTFYIHACRRGDGYTGTQVRMVATLRLAATGIPVCSRELNYPNTLNPDTSPDQDGTHEIDYLEFEFSFLPEDIIAPYRGLVQQTGYYLSIEYDGGDADNFVWIQCCRLDIYGVGYRYDTEYRQTNLAPTFGLRTTQPPRARFGIVHASRLFCIEGTNGVNPNYLWYSAVGNHLDWSTPDGGGFLDAGKPIGAVASFYDQVWVFGTVEAPFLSRLAGARPSEFSLTDTMQKVSAHYDSVTVSPSDIHFLHPAGWDSIKTMQDFGDIQANTQAENIKDIISDSYSTATIAGYEPEFGLNLVKFRDGTNDIFAMHAKLKSVRYFGEQPYVFSPVTRWRFAFPDIDGLPQAVTAFGNGTGFMYIGTDRGMVYKTDKSVLTDDGSQVAYRILSSCPSTRFGEKAAYKASPSSFGSNGGRFDLTFYVNHSRQPWHIETFHLPQPPELDQETPAGPDRVVPGGDNVRFQCNYDRCNLNFNFRSIQVGYENIVTNGNNPLFFGEVTLLAKQVGGL